MKKPPKDVLSLPLNERALMALRSAVKQAIAQQHARGLPVYIWRDGKVAELRPPKARAGARRAPKRAAAESRAPGKTRGKVAGRRRTTA